MHYQSAKPYHFSCRSLTINNPTTSVFCEAITDPTTLFVISTSIINTANRSGFITYGPEALATPTMVIVLATPFVAMWQKTDTAIIELLASLNSSATSSSATPSVISSATSSATPSASSSSKPSGGPTLRGGGIAGIVVGTLIASALIGALLI